MPDQEGGDEAAAAVATASALPEPGANAASASASISASSVDPPPPPLATLPLPIPPADDPTSRAPRCYPPSAHRLLRPLFRTAIDHPAVIVPARRTAELRRTLGHVLMRRPRMKDVYEVRPDEVIAAGADGPPEVDPRTLRKLALKRSGGKASEEGGTAETKTEADETGTGTETEAGEEGVDDDDVYSDPALGDLLRSSDPSIRKSTHTVELAYDQLTVEQVLRRVLPPSIAEVPSSFEVVGHLAHVNLREEVVPYKYIIGRTILDKNPGVDLVVNKVGNIENEFRTFPMEVLARRRGDDDGDGDGDDDIDDDVAAAETSTPVEELEVEVKEMGCRFRLDFAKVYWNSRLQYEHKRLVELIAGSDTDGDDGRDGGSSSGMARARAKARARERERGSRSNNGSGRSKKKKEKNNEEEDGTPPPPLPEIVVVDVMAGVGPFSIPLTSRYRGVTCHANDLNPVSFWYLKENARLNRCRGHERSGDGDGDGDGGGDRERGDDADEAGSSSSSISRKRGLIPYNMDGRAFVRRLDERGVRYDHVIMNLPACAPEFLDAFRGWKTPSVGERGGGGGEESGSDGRDQQRAPRSRPMVHVHCFGGKDDGAEAEAIARCERALGCGLDPKEDEVRVNVVRDVSPKKNMLCVSFRLPQGVSEVERIDLPTEEKRSRGEEGSVVDGTSSPDVKKARTE